MTRALPHSEAFYFSGYSSFPATAICSSSSSAGKLSDENLSLTVAIVLHSVRQLLFCYSETTFILNLFY
jgi:hypothetical protein